MIEFDLWPFIALYLFVLFLAMFTTGWLVDTWHAKRKKVYPSKHETNIDKLLVKLTILIKSKTNATIVGYYDTNHNMSALTFKLGKLRITLSKDGKLTYLQHHRTADTTEYVNYVEEEFDLNEFQKNQVKDLYRLWFINKAVEIIDHNLKINYDKTAEENTQPKV